MGKWEYIVLKIEYDSPDLQNELNRLGGEGWELAFSFVEDPKPHVFGQVSETPKQALVFKRPVS